MSFNLIVLHVISAPAPASASASASEISLIPSLDSAECFQKVEKVKSKFLDDKFLDDKFLDDKFLDDKFPDDNPVLFHFT